MSEIANTVNNIINISVHENLCKATLSNAYLEAQMFICIQVMILALLQPKLKFN